MPPRSSELQRWLDRTLAADPPRSKSLIMTLWGDLIAPSSKGIWLGELIALLSPFGVNERLVRTSAHRLVAQGWLEADRRGRQSWYQLTGSGAKRLEHASERIYAEPHLAWTGDWTVVLLRRVENNAEQRLQLRRELGWEGFGAPAPGLLVHPAADLTAVREVLRRLGLTESVFVFRSQQWKEAGAPETATLVNDAWNLTEVEERYRRLLQGFAPTLPLLRSGCSAQMAFVVQTLLVHTYRRAVLRDPRLPKPLLPAGWPGHDAFELCRQAYRLTKPGAQEFLHQNTTERPAGTELLHQMADRFGLSS